jgi:hypothetical protein
MVIGYFADCGKFGTNLPGSILLYQGSTSGHSRGLQKGSQTAESMGDVLSLLGRINAIL